MNFSFGELADLQELSLKLHCKVMLTLDAISFSFVVFHIIIIFINFPTFTKNVTTIKIYFTDLNNIAFFEALDYNLP